MDCKDREALKDKIRETLRPFLHLPDTPEVRAQVAEAMAGLLPDMEAGARADLILEVAMEWLAESQARGRD